MTLVIWAGGAAFAQQHELALSLGGFTAGGGLTAGKALGAVYAYRLAKGPLASLYFELPFVAGPLQTVTLAAPQATRDVSTLFVTPALRVKFAPDDARLAPFFSAGAGYALYEQSTLNQAGAPNEAPRLLHRGALMFGGGVDLKLWRFVSLRAEARDFYTGNPAFNVPVSGGRHNVAVSGSLVFRWR